MIRSFHASLTGLGLALKHRRIDRIPQEMQQVMTTWLDFSNTYSVNPPMEAKGDDQWPQRVRNVGREIGSIRKNVGAEKYSEAHDQVLSLQGTLETFFEQVSLPKKQRLFLRMSGAFSRLKSHIGQRRQDGFTEELALLQKTAPEFETMLNAHSKPIYERAQTLLNDLAVTASSTHTLGPEALTRAEKAEAAFVDLRSRLLMAEWFADPDQESVQEE